MKTNTRTRIVLFAITALLAGLSGTAQAENDNTIRVGEYFVHFDAHASDVSGSGVGYVPPGVNVSVKDVTTMYFAYVRRLSPTFDLELAFGIPPKTTIVGKGPEKLGSVPYAGQEVATSRWFSPTLLLNYKFLDESSRLRPYAGLGVNYTHFYDNTATPAGSAALGGPTSATMSDSFGWAATVGLSYRLEERWSLYASYSQSQVKSDMTANTSGVIRTTSIDFRPSLFVLSLGYHF